jgi:DNA polymerase-3 subunit delta'
VKYYDLILKNRNLVKVIDSFSRGAIGSAYLIACEDKYVCDEATALLIAAFIAGKADEKTADRVLRGGYADVKTIPVPDRRDVKVDDVKGMLDDVYYTPIELDKKFYVVSYFDTANDQAQNKLLKTLEEPPASACIILKCKDFAGILPTVKSRCSKINVLSFPIRDVEEYLASKYAQDERFYFALGVSRGFPGIAEDALLGGEGYELFRIVRETFLYMKTSKDLLHYAAIWSNQRQNMVGLLDYAELFLSDFVKFCNHEGELASLSFATKDFIAMQSLGYNAESALKILPYLTESKRKLDYYCNAQAVADWILYKILEEKTKCQK